MPNRFFEGIRILFKGKNFLLRHTFLITVFQDTSFGFFAVVPCMLVEWTF